jgi:tRNA G46 methylase TrmB
MINKPISSFARRIARRLRDEQLKLIAEVLPLHKFKAHETYPTFQKVNLEIGFGNGEFTHNIAKENPHELAIFKWCCLAA